MSGSIANWPNEPAAAEMPSAMLRFSGGNLRPSTPDTTLYVTPDSPMPISTPAVSTNIQRRRRNDIVHEAQHVQDAAGEHHARGSETVRHHAGERLRRAPDQVLHRDRQRERLAAPAHVGRDGLQEQAEAVADAHRHGQDERAATRTTVGVRQSAVRDDMSVNLCRVKVRSVRRPPRPTRCHGPAGREPGGSRP